MHDDVRRRAARLAAGSLQERPAVRGRRRNRLLPLSIYPFTRLAPHMRFSQPGLVAVHLVAAWLGRI